MANLQLVTTGQTDGGRGTDRIPDDGAICADDVLPLLLTACPSFSRRWNSLETGAHRPVMDTRAGEHHATAEARHPGSLTVGPALAHHVVMLIVTGRRQELAPTFSLIERFQTHGDHEVGMIVATELLPALRDQAIRARMNPEALFRPLLGPLSALTWDAALYFQSKGCGDPGRLNRQIECLLRALRTVTERAPEPLGRARRGIG